MTAKPGLRLGPLPKTEIVKLTFSCSAELKATLERYAELHSQAHGLVVDLGTLIPHMLDAFVARDRAFKKLTAPVRSRGMD
jgi:hypothetical protein